MFIVRSSLKEKGSTFASFARHFDQAVKTYQLSLRLML